MNAATLITSARADGLNFTVSDSGSVKLSGPQSAVDRWVPAIASNKPEIIALLRQETSAAPVAALADSSAAGSAPISPIEPPWPEPALRPVSHFAFGAVEVPHRYRRAWLELLVRCPDGVSERQWAQAIYDAHDLFETWGAKIEEMRWADDDIFERPDGLIWFL